MGLDTVSYCLVMEELGRADSSVRGIVSVNNGLVGKTIAQWGTDEQKREWLPRLCVGRGARLLRADRARLRLRPGEPRRRARSATATTGCSPARRSSSRSARGPRVALVFARTGGEGPRGITCFLVPTDAPGFSARTIKGKLGLRAQDTAELFLDGVRVPDASRLGDEGAGFKVAMSALDNGRISLAAGCVGIAQGCLDACVAYAAERRQFGKPIAGFQLVQELIADIGGRDRGRAPARLARRGARRPRASRTRSSRRTRSTTRARSPCAPRTPPCRSTAATATSTSSRSGSTCATRA